MLFLGLLATPLCVEKKIYAVHVAMKQARTFNNDVWRTHVPVFHPGVALVERPRNLIFLFFLLPHTELNL